MKRLLSIILTLCMLTALFPVTSVSAIENPKVYTYDLGWVEEGKVVSVPNMNSSYHISSTTNGYWKYYGMGDSFKAVYDANNAAFRVNNYNPCMEVGFKGTEQYIQLQLWIRDTEPKYFVPTINYFKNSGSNNIKVYIAPETASDPISEEYFVGNFACNYSGGSATLNGFMTDGTEQDYIVTIMNASTGSGHNINISNIVFTESDIPRAEYTYDLSWASDTSKLTYVPNITSYIKSAASNGYWKNYGMSEGFVYEASGLMRGYEVNQYNPCMSMTFNAVGQYAQLMLKVDGQAKCFVPTINYFKNSASNNIKVYIAPKSASNPMGEEYFKGSIACNYSGGTAELAEFMPKASETEYIVSFVNASTGSGHSINLTNIILSEVDPKQELTKIKADFGEVLTGYELKTPTVIWFWENVEIDGEKGTVSFEIEENNDGALLKADNGKIYAVAKGSATLKVSGTLDGITKTCSVDITVTGQAMSGANQSYFFYKNAYTDTTQSLHMPAELISADKFAENFPYTDYGTVRPWGMVAVKASSKDSVGNVFYHDKDYLTLSGLPGEWIAFKVKVPNPGKYIVDISAYTYRNGGMGEVYMTPYNDSMTFADITENIDTYASKDTFVGKADFNGKATAVVKHAGIGEFIASDTLDYSRGYADYLMIIKSQYSETVTYAYAVLLNSVHLVGENKIDKFETKLSNYELGVGESSEIISTTAFEKDGSVADAEEMYVEYRVAEGSENVLEISDDGRFVKALSEGTGYVETFIVADGIVKTIQSEITVNNDIGILAAYLYPDSSTLVGNPVRMQTRLELNNRKLVTEGTVEEYIIVDESAEVVVRISDNGKSIIAENEGTASVKGKITARGKVFETEPVVVEVKANALEYPANFTIDFRYGSYRGDTFVTIEQINDYTSYRNWIFHEFAGASSAYPKIELPASNGILSTICWDRGADNNHLAFKVKIPKAGKYTVDAVGYCRDRAGKIEMYMIPATSANEKNLASLLSPNTAYYFGSADFYREEASAGIKNTFGEKDVVEAGEYFVVFKLVGGKASASTAAYGDCWYPLYLTFVNEYSLNTATLSTNEGVDKINVGDTIDTDLTLFDSKGREIEYDKSTLTALSYETSDANVANISENGVITGISEGKATIKAKVTRDGVTIEAIAEIFVEDTSGINEENGIVAKLSEDTIYVYGQSNLIVEAHMNSGKAITVPFEHIEYTIVEGSNNVEISADGIITGKNVGMAVVELSVKDTFKEDSSLFEIEPVVVNVSWDSTINPAIYTLSERENAKKNAKRYSWAADIVKAAKNEADRYLDKIDMLYNQIAPEGLPRYYFVGHKYDPKKYHCRVCDVNIATKYATYGWSVNALARPWKIQCPDCKRYFPSNDFESFYKLGLTESGTYWDYEKALQKHHELFVCENAEACTCENAPHPTNERMTDEWKAYYGFGIGYLENELYSEMDEKLGVVGWGVDDSLGYMQPYISDPTLPGYDKQYFNKDGYAWYNDGTTQGPVQHTYIAYYLHEGLWMGAEGKMQNTAAIRRGLKALKNAFLYTGDAKYGRAGAILLDRIADVYQGFDWYSWESFRGDNYRGKMVDPVWSTWLTEEYADAYDAFLPIYNDPQVVSYLSGKAPRYETAEDGNWKRDDAGNLIPVNLKDSPGALRKHIEDNLLLPIFDDVRKGKIWGNFGMHQTSVIKTALALNRLPESKEMIDWVMAYGEGYNTGAEKEYLISGGSVLSTLVNKVDRDGNGNENSPDYNNLWLTNLIYVAELLDGYELYPEADLFNNVKFTKMFTSQIKLGLGGYYAPQIGDSGGVASKGLMLNLNDAMIAYTATGDRELARAMHFRNGYTAEGLRGTIFDDDPEKITRDIERIVEEDGKFVLSSDMLTGFGFAALRDGADYVSSSDLTRNDNTRDFAIYFGSNGGHGHLDTLNLFMSAFGLNIAPDLGYPEQTGEQPNRYQWVHTTISHNTVVVDEKGQEISYVTGTPHHFDDSGRVKVMDVSADVYKQADDYRRTFFMIEADDDISYGVDFFHVRGGNDHLYSFHSQSDEITAVSGLSNMKETPMYEDANGNLFGTYAGADVAYGPDPNGTSNSKYPHGYTWLKNIRSFESIDKDFSVEFNVKDWNDNAKQKRDIKLRLTMVNETPLNEVTFARALAPQKGGNEKIGELEYLLVRNKGNNLDTTFTTVYEPYEDGYKYIETVEKVKMERIMGEKPGLNDTFGAIKVTLKNGRVDYIIYSTNPEVRYNIDEKIEFRGFAGVLSLDADSNIIYSYLNDGEILKLLDDTVYSSVKAGYSGEVVDFTKTLSKKNKIIFAPENGENVIAEQLVGKYVYVDNDKSQNGVYKILGATQEGTNISLDIGDVTLVRSFVDQNNMELGYVYNIEAGNKLYIPMSNVVDTAPVIECPADVSVTVGSLIEIPLNTDSPIDNEISIIGRTLPRGARIDENNKLVWKPTASQVGENHFALTATDGMSESTVHFTVTVYGKTTGGGGGDGSPAPSTPSTPTIPQTPGTEKPVTPDVPTTPSTPTTPDVDADVRFVDLASHEWATDAINALADEGIIKGTSETTFSPAANITRADFAILLVRAFELESENTENFADVLDTDYFAKELAVARNTGLVNGIGENKFAPRNNITRQDMMVIVYRALTGMNKLNVGDGVLDVPQASDFDQVADYAKEAVSALVNAKLVNGKNGLIAPTDYTTRAEVAVLIKRILDYTK